MSATEDAILAAAAVIVLCEGKNKRKRRRFWVRPSLRKRKCTESIMNTMRLDDIDLCADNLRRTGTFHNFMRMSSTDFEVLIQKVGPHICKTNTCWRKAITVEDRLGVTLRYLATGDSYASLSYMFNISKQIISVIVPEVCCALVSELDQYVKMPTTENEWMDVAHNYERIWNFDHCVGAMDGKHITVQAPSNTGSDYYNYKCFFSIHLFAIVDAMYNFMYVNVGSQGRISDGGVLAHTTFSDSLKNSTLSLPHPRPLPGRQMDVPYVFVGDAAFPLSVNIMKPYPGEHVKGSPKRIYNYRLSRARRVVENVFGIVSSVFRVLRKPMLVNVNTAKQVTLACVHLHNYMRQSSTSCRTYTPPGTFDPEDRDTDTTLPGAWRREPPPVASMLPLHSCPDNSSVEAQNIRTEFTHYFISNQGRVHWQYHRS